MNFKKHPAKKETTMLSTHYTKCQQNVFNSLILPVLICIVCGVSVQLPVAATLKVTAQLISNHQYPVEEHTVLTSDKYILTIYRIPHSPKLCTQNVTSDKPVVFLQHGILSASDDWIIIGPENSLAFLFADMGYDVWLGNARGNTYSRQHKYKHPDSSDFWNFSWHEIGVYDLAAMLDYVLNETRQESLHFVGHSQGTTTFFVLMTQQPWYNDKMRTVHLLAPVAFLRDHSFLLSKLGKILLGYPTFLSMFFTSLELFPTTSLQKLLCGYICSPNTSLSFLCSGILDFVGGWGTKHLNYTLLPHLCETHPAGASTTQIIHYMQLYNSGDFKQFDYGMDANLKIYQQETPPHYDIGNVNTCVHLYYSDNDYISAAADVEHLATLLPCVELIRIPYADWNHYDFLWSINVKEVINDRIIEKIENHERISNHCKQL